MLSINEKEKGKGASELELNHLRVQVQRVG